MSGLRQVFLALAVACVGLPAAAQETKEIRLAKQFGISYLPMAVMEERKLIEKHAQAAGLGPVTVSWLQINAGAPMNDSLISGNIDFASGGVGPLLTIWARTRASLGVRAISTINSMPLYLNTINPKVTTLKDFGDGDRIALPAVKVSIQAVTLQMAAEKQLGKFDALDRLTVSMAHPDGHAALMTGKTEITAHFTSAPFMYLQLADPRVRRVLSSYEVLGGPATFNLIWTTAAFREKNPRGFKAVLAAIEEAVAFIAADPTAAAKLWIEVEKSRLDPAFIEKIIRDPENVFTTTPQNTMKYAEFMHRTGSIKELPASWKDLFFAEVHDKAGS